MNIGFGIQYTATKTSIVNPGTVGLYTAQHVEKFESVYSKRLYYLFDKTEMDALTISDPSHRRKILTQGWMLKGGLWFYDIRLCSIQHSLRPNCSLHSFSSKDDTHTIQVLSDRYILEGEELTINLMKDLDPEFEPYLRDRFKTLV